MDHSFRNRPPGRSSDFQTSAAQQQDPSQAVARPPAYQRAYPHPDLGVTGYTPTPQESVFMQMQMQVPQEAHLMPSAVSLEPVLPATLQRWSQEQNPSGTFPGGPAAFPLGDPAAAWQQGGTMPMQGYQGFGADPGQMSHQSHNWAQPSPMHQQVGYPDPRSWHAQFPIIHQSAAPDLQASFLREQRGNLSAALDPSQGKRPRAEADAMDLPPTKRQAMGGAAGTASVAPHEARMLSNARLPGMTDQPSALPGTSGSEARELNIIEMGKHGKKSKEKHIQTRFPFVHEETGTQSFTRNKKLLAKLGFQNPRLTNSEKMDKVLLACEKAVPGGPRDGDNELTLEGNGHKAYVFWSIKVDKIKGDKTALWTIVEDPAQFKEKVGYIKRSRAGKQAKALGIPSLDCHTVGQIQSRAGNVRILEELGYEEKGFPQAVRALSTACDSALGAAKDKSIFNTDLPDVQHFKFSGFGPRKQDVEVLRWVENNVAGQLLLFRKNQLMPTLEKMRTDIAQRNAAHMTKQFKASLPAEHQALDNGVDTHAAGNISKRHNKVLMSMGWENVRTAIHELATLCEITACTPQGGVNTRSGTRLPDVEHFTFPQGAPGQQPLEVLRWKLGDKVREILPFEVGGIEAALKKMEKTMANSRRAQRGWLR